MSVDRFVYLLCPARSGSNLTRAILSQHPDIFIVSSMTLFEDVAPYVSAYGDLAHDEGWRELLDDLSELTNLNHSLIVGKTDPENLYRRLQGKGRTLGSAVEAIYKEQVEMSGATIGGVKFNNRFEFVPAMMEQMHFTDIIYQRRDPRDVYVSQIRTGTCGMLPHQYAEYWSEGNAFIREAMAGFTGPMLEIAYEDLVTRPEDIVNALWRFLGVEPCDKALAFYEDNYERENAARNHMLANLSQPVMRANTGTYYRHWNLIDAKRFERYLGDELLRTHYRPSKPWRFRSLTRQPEAAGADDLARHGALHADRYRILEGIKAKAENRSRKGDRLVG